MPLSSPEAKAALAEAIEAATGPLLAKNKELLAELKTARKSAEITPEQLAQVEEERDKLKADLTAAQKQVKEATANAEKATKALESESAAFVREKTDRDLLEALSQNGVTDPVYQEAALSMLRGNVQIVADGEKRIAKVGDKALSDHVKEWATSDKGKRFVAAAANTGGGSQGGGSQGGGGKTMSRTDFATKTPAEQMAHIKGGGTVTD